MPRPSATTTPVALENTSRSSLMSECVVRLHGLVVDRLCAVYSLFSAWCDGAVFQQ